MIVAFYFKNAVFLALIGVNELRLSIADIFFGAFEIADTDPIVIALAPAAISFQDNDVADPEPLVEILDATGPADATGVAARVEDATFLVDSPPFGSVDPLAEFFVDNAITIYL